jgi:undecaprenyl-phosphate alpha-N-acetylglucosaminyl 1-phosphatetransferase
MFEFNPPQMILAIVAGVGPVFVVAALGMLVTLVVLMALVPNAARLGLVDYPDARKRHHQPTPLVGGLAIFVGLLVSVAVAAPLDATTPILLAAFAFTLLGLVDDRLDLNGPLRSVVQTGLIAAFVWASGITVTDLGLGFEIPSHPGISTVAFLFTVVAVLGLVNAFNLIDGLDGLAAGLAIISLAGVGLGALVSGHGSHALTVVVLIAPIAAFWLANMGALGAHLKTFLGDSGATLLGFLVAVCLVQASQPNMAVIDPVFVLWCVAVPVIDTLQVMWNRLRAGRSIFDSDRRHMHYQLVDMGYSNTQAMAVMLAGNALIIVLGLVLTTLSPLLSLLVFIALVVAYANLKQLYTRVVEARRYLVVRRSRRRFDTL